MPREENVAPRGKFRGERCVKGNIARGESSRGGSDAIKIVVSGRGNTRGRDTGFERSRGQTRATASTWF